jgi:hypothetical protein
MQNLTTGWALLPLLLLSQTAAAATPGPERLEKARTLLEEMTGATDADKLQALKHEALPIPDGLVTDRAPAHDTPLYDSRQGGEDFSQAFPVTVLPFADAGTTAGALNDYSPGCGFSAAPDVVYSYTPEQDITVDVDLCGSAYDTILSVFANDNSTLVGCNDDACAAKAASSSSTCWRATPTTSWWTVTAVPAASTPCPWWRTCCPRRARSSTAS